MHGPKRVKLSVHQNLERLLMIGRKSIQISYRFLTVIFLLCFFCLGEMPSMTEPKVYFNYINFPQYSSCLQF